MAVEYASVVFAALLVATMIVMLVVSFSKTKKAKSIEGIYKFEIVYSAGTYDVRLNGIRLVSKCTFGDAKTWLADHRDYYMLSDKTHYTEEYVVVENGKIIRIK